MRNALRWRFWFEAAMATVTSILFMTSLMQRDWIEIVFGIDPDNRSGALEWLVVGFVLVMTVLLFTLANYEWRRARAAIS